MNLQAHRTMEVLAGDAISLFVVVPVGLVVVALLAKLRRPRPMNLAEVRQRLGHLQ